MPLDDEAPTGDRVVRSFLVTGGRATVKQAVELPLESRVCRTAAGQARIEELAFERRDIVEFASEPNSIAEISAHLGLPMLSSLVLVSELVDSGFLEAADVVEEVNMESLQLIRNALLKLGAKS